MSSVLLVIHVFLAIALGAVVLLQRPESSGLGSIGGGGNSGALAPRASANPLSRMTAILAAAFMLTSLALAFNAAHHAGSHSLLERLKAQAAAQHAAAPSAPGSAGSVPVPPPAASAAPSGRPVPGPSVPVAP